MKTRFKPVALTFHGSSFKVTHPKQFGLLNIPLPTSALEQVLEFSWKMTFGKQGQHRAYRTGGSEIRTDLMVFRDVYRGKLGEVAFYYYCQQRPRVQQLSHIDFSCSGKGIWDCADFIVNDEHHISIKTTKDFGNLLYLEAKDWEIDLLQHKAIYKPNQHDQSKNRGIYDYFFLCRVKSNIDAIIHQISQEPQPATLDDLKLKLFRILKLQKPKLDIAGYISNSDLYQVLQQETFLLQAGTFVGKSAKPQDAENYYVQSGCMRPLMPWGSRPIQRSA
ncbi:hypothetical protein D9K79_08745 [Acinetobacter cumulans]|uniref:Uncharacterized protein n=1 Tax=Acinetobacter cumulans TaxID=2136182 RepID=A0A498CYU1_9GAMM|nr:MULTISPECIES: hypothetical protein [Acinetobacter]NWK75014.1 hypothetical protein [Acinetobacter sp. SwsAc6]QCO20265.1 hypothetical protein C9E88_001355 [Acinetobacter cumulans]RFS31706.1 hypothetical protein DYI81_07525 [Acinetobacter sp. SWAC5]RKG49423.1 hypothetical protein D7V68_06215 [Acinetobacter cumulans]RLL37293.1 hypothetical protein D9K80_03785 [Acinetobacter cumulans]